MTHSLSVNVTPSVDFNILNENADTELSQTWAGKQFFIMNSYWKMNKIWCWILWRNLILNINHNKLGTGEGLSNWYVFERCNLTRFESCISGGQVVKNVSNATISILRIFITEKEGGNMVQTNRPWRSEKGFISAYNMFRNMNIND